MDDYFVFDGVKSTDKDIVLLDYRPLLLPQKKRVFVEIPGRDGSIATGSDAKEDIELLLNCAVIGENEADMLEKVRLAKPWLMKRGKLSFWDEPDKYYIGEAIRHTPVVRKISWGEFDLYFRCEPVAYGQQVVEVLTGGALANAGTYKAAGKITVEIGGAASFLRIALVETGEFIYLEDEFVEGDVVVVDLEKEKVTKGGYLIMDKLSLDSDFFLIPAGEYTITIEPDVVVAQLEYVERWL